MTIDKNKLTIRISDNKFNEEINKTSRYAIFNGDAMSKNDFIQQMIRIGLDEYKKAHDTTNSNNININITAINTNLVSLKQSIDKLTDYLLKRDKLSNAYDDALLLLVAEVLGVAIDASLGVPVKREDIDDGFYDDIPEKILNIIKEAIK